MEGFYWVLVSHIEWKTISGFGWYDVVQTIQT